MTEQDYKRIYGDSDDAAKLFRKEDPVKCKVCREIADNESDICEHCLKQQDYINDFEN